MPTSRTITINGTTYDLSANRSWDITSMIYPAAGIPLSTGTAWGTSITNNSANWNTAYGWGNHASAGYLTGITSTQVTTALGYTPYNGTTNPNGYITGISFANVSSKPTTLSGYGITDAVPSSRTITINGTALDLSANRSWTVSGSDSTKLPLSGGTLTGNLKITPVSESWGEGLAFVMPATTTWGGIRWRRERADYDGNWAIGYTALDNSDDLVFIANNGSTQVNNILRLQKDGTIKIRYRTYIHTYGASGGENLFTQLESPSTANGRAQFVLSSSYSDLVIASSQSNNNHGSTLSFTTYNPSNAADYRKFVINQGNWGARAGFLDFGFADTASGMTNPHNLINSSYVTLTVNGYNKRIGIDQMSPSYTLDVNGLINTPTGFISVSNPWGTSNSAFFPNGITTAGGTNWIYGNTYIGNAPSNGAGSSIGSNGSFQFRNSNTSGTWGYAGQFVDRNNAANNYASYSFEQEYGNHSWGIVARFHIQQSGADRPSIQFSSASSNTRWSIGYVSGSDDNFRITQNHSYRIDGSGISDGWGTERLRIDTGGNISNGSVWINSGANSNNYNENIRLFNAPNGVSVIAFSATGDSGMPTTSILGYSDRMEFRYNNNWQFRIWSGYATFAGNLNTAGKITVDNATLDSHFLAAGGAPSYRLANSVSGPAYQGLLGMATYYGHFVSMCNPGDTVVLGITSGGRVFITSGANGAYMSYNATSFTSNSDIRLKNITGGIDNAIDKIKSLRAIKYTWKSDDTNKVNIGLVAQEVQAVLPELVDVGNDSMGTLGVRYSEMIPVVVKGIQEQQNKIEELTNMVSLLQETIQTLLNK